MGKDERVRAVSQQLLSRPVLERVVREEGLARGGRTVDDVVDEMLAPDRVRVRADAALEAGRRSDRAPLEHVRALYAGPSRRRRSASPTVSPRSSSRPPREAARRRAEDTSAFIGAQLEASKTRLDTLEAQLRKAKEAYMGPPPRADVRPT